jgi:hypothetical protein
MATQRTARELIHQAIRENRAGEWLCYIFAVIFVVVGVGVIIWGAAAGQGIVAVAGSIASVLF